MRFTQKTLAILLALLLVSGGPAFPQQASSAVSEAVSSVGGTVQPSAGGVSRIDTKAPLTREDLNPYQIAVPQELGSIEEVFQGSSNSPLIVYIQNVHANYEAQKNIKGILNQLVDQYQFSLVQMEGAVSKLNPEILKPSYLEEANLQLVDFLMREGRITGADAFAVETDKPVAFYGVEDRGLYMENLKTFKSVYRHQEEVNAFFGEIHRLILDIGPKLLNPELLDFTRKTEAFGTDRIDLMDYLVYLNELSERHSLVSLKDMKEIFEYPNLVRLMRLHVLEEKLNQSGLKKETEALKQEFQKRMPGSEKMEELTAKLDESVKGTNPRSYFIELTKLADEAKIDFINYPAFRIFAEFLIHQDEIDHRALFSELKRFEKSLQDELFTKEDEQKFLEIIDYTGLLEQYFRLEMSREKLVLYLNHRDEMKPSWISNELSALAVKYAVQAKPVSNTETLDAYMDELEYFYQLVLKRDEIFTQRILEQMKSLKQDKTVVITGGFHKDGLVDYFRKENISYVIVNPKVDIAQGSENYLKVMLEGDAVVGSVFAGTFAIEVKVLTDTTALANQDRAFLGNAYVAAGVNTARRAGVTANVQAALNKRAEVIGSQAGVFVEFTQPFRPAGQLVLASGTRITRQHVQPSGAVLAQGISVREQIDEGGNFEVVPEAEFKPTTREEQLAGIRPELVGRAPTQSAAADIPDRSEFPRLAASLIRPPTDITEPVTPPVTP
ncbi:MAG: hypothetical protein HY588_03805, partial [Candidatus Omnitrophica bacterium]|nr:hypothetical protein [Candidatus Omnitrophota bacterium]